MTYQPFLHEFARRLRLTRKERNLTQEQLAELVDKSVEYISLLERAERFPSFEMIIDLATTLQTPTAYLMNIDKQLDDERLLDRLPLPHQPDTDLERLQAALTSIRQLQELANEYGIQDIFQDNGGKVLQVLIILGLRISPGREGSDAIDQDGNEYELKTINLALNRNAGVTTHHHLNKDILEKYRRVKAWYIALYKGIELQEIYRVDTPILEPLFKKWEARIEAEGMPLNNPKISIPNYVKKGVRVYPE